MNSSFGPFGPPGSGPGAFPPGQPGFFHQAYSQQAEAWDIAARSSQVRGPLLVPEERNNVLLDHPPLDVVLQAAVTLGEETEEGQIIQAVAIPWLRFLDDFKRDPANMHRLDWRDWETLIAAACSDAGYSVVLTPRSGDAAPQGQVAGVAHPRGGRAGYSGRTMLTPLSSLSWPSQIQYGVR
jgi:hypothetical protein